MSCSLSGLGGSTGENKLNNQTNVSHSKKATMRTGPGHIKPNRNKRGGLIRDEF